jgi:flagellar biosynthesis GTPase FlhF
MSLIQSMRDAGRPVAYYPRLARFFGSVNASIFFSQLAYWQDRTNNPLGTYKTTEEWEEETGLSYREQVTARKHLATHGFLVETHKRLEHRVFYRLNFDTIDVAFGEWTKRHSPNCATSNSPNDESAVRGVRIPQFVSKTETTAETTAETIGGERAQAPAPAPPVPKRDDDFAEQVQAQAQAQAAQAARLAAEQAAAEATRIAAEQKAAAAAQDAAQEAAKAPTQARAPAKAEKPAKAAKSAIARATDFPADFAPNAACIELANTLGVTLDGVDGELARFEDYHAAQGTTFKDWQAGLRTWIRNAAKFAKRDRAVAAVKSAPAAETAYQRSMRERVQEFAPSIARKAPEAPGPKSQSAVDFFNTIEMPARTVGALK